MNLSSKTGDRSLRLWWDRALWALSVTLVIVAYGRHLGRNPWGVFCDELLIGVRARQLLDGRSLPGPNPAFMDHFGTVAGTLPAYAVAPFFFLFGESDVVLRLSTVVITIAMFTVMWSILRLMHLPGSDLAMLFFATTPIVIHLSRITFGHAISLLCIALGYRIYLQSSPASLLILAPVGGMVAGLAAYGYPGFYVALPVFAALVWIGGLLTPPSGSRFASTLFAIGAYIVYLPIVDQVRNNDTFFARFEAKDGSGSDLISTERLHHVLDNYPKYLNGWYWFIDGETGWPGFSIQRHSVTGAGLLSLLTIPILVAAIVGIIRYRRTPAMRIALPFLLLVPLLPAPDILSTADSAPPYAFALFTGALAIPFVAAFGIAWLISAGKRWRGIRAICSPVTIHTAILIAATIFVFHTYAGYPTASSGFWGWQGGAREMIAYYLDHEDEYDQFVLDPERNEPQVFLDFYIADPEIRARATVGDLDAFDATRHQLFGMRRAVWETIPDKQNWTVLETIDIPGDPGAFLMVTRAAPTAVAPGFGDVPHC